MRIADVVVGERYAHSRSKPYRKYQGCQCVKVLNKDGEHQQYGNSMFGRGSTKIRALTVCDAMGKEFVVPARQLRMTWKEYEDGRDRVQRGQILRMNKEDELEREADNMRESLAALEIEAEIKVWNTPTLNLKIREPGAARLLAQALDTVARLGKYDREHLLEHLEAAGLTGDE